MNGGDVGGGSASKGGNANKGGTQGSGAGLGAGDGGKLVTNMQVSLNVKFNAVS